MATPRISVKNYMEQKMTDLHYTSSEFNLWYKTQSFLLAAAIVIGLPFIHIGVIYLMIWVPDKPPVDRRSCTCSCFDTVFKGSYENPGPGKYKHLYFNATKETFQIWVLTVIFILMCFESVKYLYKLFRCGNLRKSMFVLYLANIYPHYFSWWAFVNYFNEGLYQYHANQYYFTITEIISSVVVLNLCNAVNNITSWKILLIIGISSMHIMVSAADQFIVHVFYGRGLKFQNARNFGLMIPDVMHIFIAVFLLYRYARQNKLGMNYLFCKAELIICFIGVTFGTLVGNLL